MQTTPFVPLPGALTGRPSSSRRRFARRAALVASAALLLVAPTWASAATSPKLYWTSPSTSSIGSADRDGMNIERALLDTQSFSPGGIGGGVVSDGTYLYWPDPDSHAIGRALVNGTNVEPRFITGLPFNGVYGDSVRSLIVAGSFLFWRNPSGSIGRANKDGSDVRPNLIPPGHGTELASDGTYLYYVGPDDPSGRSIGRANFDGTGVNDDFIALPADAWVSELAATATNLFWVGNDGIFRANLNGTSQTKIVTPTDSVGALTANATHIFWAEEPSGAAPKIQRATTSGAGLDASFITGSGSDYSTGQIAVDATSVYYSHGDAIRRAPLTGGPLQPPIITGFDQRPWSVAADESHLYWVTGTRYRDEDRTVRRASLTGIAEPSLPTGDAFARDLTLASGVLYWSGDRRYYDESYGIYVSSTGGGAGKMAADGSSLVLGEVSGIGDVAVDASSVYITRTPGDERDIFRTSLDLAAAFTNWASVPGANAIATAGGFVYWVGNGGGIDRQLANGTGLQTDFIPGIQTAHLAADTEYLYWTDTNGNRIGRAKLDGTNINQNFVTGVAAPTDIAVTATAPPPVTTPTTPQPENPAPTGPSPQPATTPTPPPPPALPTGSGGSTIPVPSKPTVVLSARSAKRGQSLVLTLTGLSNGTKLTATWKPKRGRTTRATHRVRGAKLKIKAPKKRGQYTLVVKAGTTSLLNTRVTVR